MVTCKNTGIRSLPRFINKPINRNLLAEIACRYKSGISNRNVDGVTDVNLRRALLTYSTLHVNNHLCKLVMLQKHYRYSARVGKAPFESLTSTILFIKCYIRSFILPCKSLASIWSDSDEWLWTPFVHISSLSTDVCI